MPYFNNPIVGKAIAFVTAVILGMEIQQNINTSGLVVYTTPSPFAGFYKGVIRTVFDSDFWKTIVPQPTMVDHTNTSAPVPSPLQINDTLTASLPTTVTVGSYETPTVWEEKGLITLQPDSPPTSDNPTTDEDVIVINIWLISILALAAISLYLRWSRRKLLQALAVSEQKRIALEMTMLGTAKERISLQKHHKAQLAINRMKSAALVQLKETDTHLIATNKRLDMKCRNLIFQVKAQEIQINHLSANNKHLTTTNKRLHAKCRDLMVRAKWQEVRIKQLKAAHAAGSLPAADQFGDDFNLPQATYNVDTPALYFTAQPVILPVTAAEILVTALSDSDDSTVVNSPTNSESSIVPDKQATCEDNKVEDEHSVRITSESTQQDISFSGGENCICLNEFEMPAIAFGLAPAPMLKDADREGDDALEEEDEIEITNELNEVTEPREAVEANTQDTIDEEDAEYAVKKQAAWFKYLKEAEAENGNAADSLTSDNILHDPCESEPEVYDADEEAIEQAAREAAEMAANSDTVQDCDDVQHDLNELEYQRRNAVFEEAWEAANAADSDVDTDRASSALQIGDNANQELWKRVRDFNTALEAAKGPDSDTDPDKPETPYSNYFWADHLQRQRIAPKTTDLVTCVEEALPVETQSATEPSEPLVCSEVELANGADSGIESDDVYDDLFDGELDPAQEQLSREVEEAEQEAAAVDSDKDDDSIFGAQDSQDGPDNAVSTESATCIADTASNSEQSTIATSEPVTVLELESSTLSASQSSSFDFNAQIPGLTMTKDPAEATHSAAAETTFDCSFGGEAIMTPLSLRSNSISPQSMLPESEQTQEDVRNLQTDSTVEDVAEGLRERLPTLKPKSRKAKIAGQGGESLPSTPAPVLPGLNFFGQGGALDPPSSSTLPFDAAPTSFSFGPASAPTALPATPMQTTTLPPPSPSSSGPTDTPPDVVPTPVQPTLPLPDASILEPLATPPTLASLEERQARAKAGKCTICDSTTHLDQDCSWNVRRRRVLVPKGKKKGKKQDPLHQDPPNGA